MTRWEKGWLIALVLLAGAVVTILLEIWLWHRLASLISFVGVYLLIERIWSRPGPGGRPEDLSPADTAPLSGGLGASKAMVTPWATKHDPSAER